jgi:hypothetical protein
MTFKSHKIKLSKLNARNLRKGKPTLIKHDQYDPEGIEIFLGHLKHRKMETAHKKKKGFKLNLSQDELKHSEEHGKGFKDFFSKAYKGYQKYVKPLVGDEIRKGLKEGAKTAIKTAAVAIPTALGQPELAVPASAVANSKITDRLIDKGIDKLGDLTGGFGLRNHYKLENNMNGFLNARHPAQDSYNPPYLPDMSIPRALGSSRPLYGYGVKPVVNSMYKRGTPLNPHIDPHDQSYIPRYANSLHQEKGVGLKASGYGLVASGYGLVASGY